MRVRAWPGRGRSRGARLSRAGTGRRARPCAARGRPWRAGARARVPVAGSGCFVSAGWAGTLSRGLLARLLRRDHRAAASPARLVAAARGPPRPPWSFRPTAGRSRCGGGGGGWGCAAAPWWAAAGPCWARSRSVSSPPRARAGLGAVCGGSAAGSALGTGAAGSVRNCSRPGAWRRGACPARRGQSSGGAPPRPFGACRVWRGRLGGPLRPSLCGGGGVRAEGAGGALAWFEEVRWVGMVRVGRAALLMSPRVECLARPRRRGCGCAGGPGSRASRCGGSRPRLRAARGGARDGHWGCWGRVPGRPSERHWQRRRPVQTRGDPRPSGSGGLGGVGPGRWAAGPAAVCGSSPLSVRRPVRGHGARSRRAEGAEGGSARALGPRGRVGGVPGR